jgi:hypothetical protein
MRRGGCSKNVGARGSGLGRSRWYSDATGEMEWLVASEYDRRRPSPEPRAPSPDSEVAYCLTSCPRITPDPFARVCTLK